MTEYCFPGTINTNTNKKKLSDFSLLCSFILSHPLYFSYLVFFSPYLLKLLSFLSPLFITTSLLLLSLLTTLIPLHSFNSKDGFFLTASNTLLEKLHPRFDDDGEKTQSFEEFEVYKIVFEIPAIELLLQEQPSGNPIKDDIRDGLDVLGLIPDKQRPDIEGNEENPDGNGRLKENPVGFSKKIEEETGDKCESLTMEGGTGGPNPKKVKEEMKKQELILTRSGSEAVKEKKLLTEKGQKPRGGGSVRVDNDKKLVEAFSQTVGGPPYLGSFGSMRKEKEWRRTLACKIFEERHNVNHHKDNANGGSNEEGMDLLWETYETESNRGNSKEETKKGRKREKVENIKVVNYDDDHMDDDDDYVDDDHGKICCLQALKLSAGKMNLSMGRPNLVKISKAFKGIGWLQSHVRRQSKKGYK